MTMATECNVSLATLQDIAGITDDQLDGKMDEQHLVMLAGLFGDCERFVGIPGLGLNEAQKADVKDTAFLRGHEMGMRKALTLWMKRESCANYRSLIGILLELQEGVVAERVCNATLTPSLPNENKPQGSASMPLSLGDKVRWFEEQFYCLQESAQKELTENGITLQSFRQSLARVSSSIKAEHKQFLKDNYPIFREAKAIDDIFFHLGLYLSFIDSSLLEHIIEHFGSLALKQRMGQYSRDMTEFRQTTTVADIIPYLSGRPEPPPEYVKLELELDYNPRTCTLEELEQARIKLGKEFSLSKFALFLLNIQEGSVIAVCLLPSECAHLLLSLSINSRYVYRGGLIKKIGIIIAERASSSSLSEVVVQKGTLLDKLPGMKDMMDESLETSTSPLHMPLQAVPGMSSYRASTISTDSGFGPSGDGVVRHSVHGGGFRSASFSEGARFLREPKSTSKETLRKSPVQILDNSSEMGYENCKWFWGFTSREEAKHRLLLEGTIGNFIVRINARGEFVMTHWRHKDRISHHKIINHGTIFRFEESVVEMEGKSLVDLLDMYMKTFPFKFKPMEPFGGALYDDYNYTWHPPAIDKNVLQERLKQQKQIQENAARASRRPNQYTPVGISNREDGSLVTLNPSESGNMASQTTSVSHTSPRVSYEAPEYVNCALEPRNIQVPTSPTLPLSERENVYTENVPTLPLREPMDNPQPMQSLDKLQQKWPTLT